METLFHLRNLFIILIIISNFSVIQTEEFLRLRYMLEKASSQYQRKYDIQFSTTQSQIKDDELVYCEGEKERDCKKKKKKKQKKTKEIKIKP